MNPENRSKLAERVIRAAEAALAARNYVSPIDVLVGIRWLDPGAVKRWQRGQVEYLEGVVQTKLSRIPEAMKLFRSWATAKGLLPSETHYVAKTPQRQALRFSKSGDPTIERLYRTHWISGELSKGKRERLAAKASRAPELVVIQPLNDAWKCHQCGGTRRSSRDGKSRPSVLAVRRTRWSRVPVRRKCSAYAAGQGKKHEICRGRTI
jgi:hypothetical protein